MNRFLKKQWDDTKIPESVRLKARRRAWERLQPRRRSLLPGTAAAAALAGALFFLWLGTAPQAPPAAEAEPLPLAGRLQPEVSTLPPAKLAEAAAPVRPKPQPRHAEPARDRSPDPPGADIRDAPSPVRPTTLVLNFRLPESGVRMIWVQDSNFVKQTGETE